MNYEEKYEQALKRARDYYLTGKGEPVDFIKMIFPELQESEDERIRKGIIRNLQYLMDRSEGFVKEDLQERIAWLEKQGTPAKLGEKEIQTAKDEMFPYQDNVGRSYEQAWAASGFELGAHWVLNKLKSNGYSDETYKQGEFGTFDAPQTPFNEVLEVTSRMQYISDDMKPIAEFIMDYANWDLRKEEWSQPTLTVPLFRVLDALIQRGKPYGECSQNIEKQGEQKQTWEPDAAQLIVIKDLIEDKSTSKVNKVILRGMLDEFKQFTKHEIEKQSEPQGKTALEVWKDMRLEVYQQASGNRHEPNYSDDTTKMFSLNDIDEIIEKISEHPTADKIEPKFNVGNWVILPLGIIAHIDSLNSTDYQVTTTDGKICDFKISKQDNYHLWSISDARDGDVLSFYLEYKGNKMVQTGIIEKYVGKHRGCSNTFKVYVGVDWENNFQIGEYMGCSDIRPATKEQRDLLFQKIKEAGYKWDAYKKELKKNERK